MGRSSYRMRTNQRISDILKSITKKQLIKTTEDSSELYDSINNMRFLIESKPKSYEISAPSNIGTIGIDKILMTVPERTSVSSNVIYGKSIPYLLSNAGTVFYADGIQNSSGGYFGSGGVVANSPIADNDNATISMDSIGSLVYGSVINSKTLSILYSEENTRPTIQTIFATTEPFDINNQFIFVFVNGVSMNEGIDYTVASNTTIETTFDVEVADRVEIFKIEGEINAIYFNSILLLSSIPALVEGSYIKSALSNVGILHIEKGIYRITSDGSDLNASFIKVGASLLSSIGNSEYIVTNGVSPSTGAPISDCLQYAQVIHISGLFLELFGSLAYSDNRTFEGVDSI